MSSNVNGGRCEHVVPATNTPQGHRTCVVIKTASNSITVQPLWLLLSRFVRGYFHQVIVVADFSSSQGLEEGEGWCGAGWLNLLSGRWAAQGSFSLWRLFLTRVLFSFPQPGVLGLTACSGPGLWGTQRHRSQSCFSDWTQAAELEEEEVKMIVERVGGLTCPYHRAGQKCHLVGSKTFTKFHWGTGNSKDPYFPPLLPKSLYLSPLYLHFSTWLNSDLITPICNEDSENI